MTRFTPILIALLCCPAWATALPSRPKDIPFTADRLPTALRDVWPQRRPDSVCPTWAAGEFILTTQTEVLLDGRACAYADVPPGAAVIRLEVAPDGRTVLKAHFRSPPRARDR